MSRSRSVYVVVRSTATRLVAAGCVLAGMVNVPHAQVQHNFSYTIGAPGNVSEIALKGDIGKGAVEGGAYGYSIPIEVPPGPRGTAPQIALTHTGGGNGPVGKGWSLSFGAVSRDASEGVPQNLNGVGANDRFLLNGVRLVRQGATSRYRTEIERHQHITYDAANNKWVVLEPNGTRSEYSAAVTAYDKGGANLGTRAWLLGSVSDTRGNTVTYQYTSSYPSGGIRYPSEVTWGAPGTKRVTFTLESRPDKRTSYAEGSRVFDDQRISRIDVIFGPGTGTVLRRYTLV